MAFAHVGHVAAFALMKTHQHLAFFVHVAHRQTTTVSVAPSGAGNGAQQRLGLDLAQVPQVVFECALLNRHLRQRVEVLHFAAATGTCMQTKMGALWGHPQSRLTVNVGERSLLPRVFATCRFGADPFIGQCAINKHHLAVRAASHALSIKVDGLNQQGIGR